MAGLSPDSKQKLSSYVPCSDYRIQKAKEAQDLKTFDLTVDKVEKGPSEKDIQQVTSIRGKGDFLRLDVASLGRNLSQEGVPARGMGLKASWTEFTLNFSFSGFRANEEKAPFCAELDRLLGVKPIEKDHKGDPTKAQLDQVIKESDALIKGMTQSGEINHLSPESRQRLNGVIKGLRELRGKSR